MPRVATNSSGLIRCVDSCKGTLVCSAGRGPSWPPGANTKGENSAPITGWHGGKRAGSGRRYLGCSTWVVEKVRELLARVQQELRQGRQLRRLERTARAAMRWSKELLRKELGRLGLWLKGFEIRGGRLADAIQTDPRQVEHAVEEGGWRLEAGTDPHPLMLFA